jgi:hypothetical protein
MARRTRETAEKAYVDDMEPGMATAGGVQRRYAAPTVKKGRPGVIVLIALVVEIVVIAALANQVVTKHWLNFVAAHNDRFAGHLVAAFTTYQWRFSAQAGDRANEPLAHICLVLVVLGLTALLVLAVCRGPVTFWRVFLGTWMAVVVATLVGQVVFNLVSPPPYPPGFTNAAGAVFTGPNGFGFVAGLMLGLVTAIFTAIFAVATRRTVRLAAPAGFEQSPRDEYTGEQWWTQTLAYGSGEYQQGGYPAGYPQGPEQGYQQPYGQPYDQPHSGSYYGDSYGDNAGGGAAEHSGGDDATQQMPAVPDDEQAQPAAGDDQPTEAIPVPPSDADAEPETGSGSGEAPADEEVSQQPGQREA